MKRIPKIDFESKPKITISIHPLHQAFLRFLFQTPEKQKYIILSRRLDVGKLIFAHIMAGDFPVKRPLMEHPVTFILPIPGNEHGYWLRYRHIYFPDWCQQKINDAIEYEFRVWTKDRFRMGYDIEGMDQKTIINAILRGINARNNVANFDMIKKIDYRNKRKIEEIHFKRLITAELSEC